MEKKILKKGLFITFEGPEGCGKSTQSKLLTEFLKKRGFKVFYTFEPGGTYIGRQIREILLDPKNSKMNDFCELLLFEAARSQLVKEIIKPCLDKKLILISDRFNDATAAYQGFTEGINMPYIKGIEKYFMNNLKPDLTILLDIEAKVGLYRSKSKSGFDRMEQKGLSYHKKVRSGYLKLLEMEPDRIKLVKVQDNIFDTQKIIREIVLNVISRYTRAR